MPAGEMGSCYASTGIFPWNTDQMKITLDVTTIIQNSLSITTI